MVERVRKILVLFVKVDKNKLELAHSSVRQASSDSVPAPQIEVGPLLLLKVFEKWRTSELFLLEPRKI